MEFRARVIKGVIIPDEPGQLPEGREVVLSLVEISEEPDQKSAFENLLEQMESAYDELVTLLSQRETGVTDPALEAKITAKQAEIAQYRSQRAQQIEEALKSQRSAAEAWEEALAEAKRYAKELHEASPDDTTP